MLNGKFFTGLPPKMIDRSGGTRNRLESHLFWPDDTKAESPIETKLRRRASLQLDATDRPRLQSQLSFDTANEVDTRQRFHKEFAKSSIQFYDNIQEEEDEAAQRRNPRPMRILARPMKQGVAAKPTATKLELPDNEIDEEYANIRKKQAFTSKIKFYDYVDDDLNKRNNARRPKMDMNNKREVERNTKNSPKLQMKRNMRELNEDYVSDYQREQFTPERNYENGEHRNIRNPVHETTPYDEDIPPRDRNQSPRKNSQNNNLTQNKKINRNNLQNLDYEYDDEMQNNRSIYTDREPMNNFVKARSVPRQTLNNRLENSRMRNDDEYFDDIERNMRNVRLRSSPRKHVTYDDEQFDEEFYQERHHSDDGLSTRTTHRFSSSRNSSPTKPSNLRTGNDRDHDRHDQRQQLHCDTDYGQTSEFNETTEVLSQHMETGSGATKKVYNNEYYNNNKNSSSSNNNFTNKSNNNQNNNKNKSYNKSPQRQRSSQQSPQLTRRITPKMSTKNKTLNSDRAEATTTTTTTTADFKKHLRSNISFHNGEIVANNDTDITNAPTSSSSRGGTPMRRNARSSATQRVSVGLPD